MNLRRYIVASVLMSSSLYSFGYYSPDDEEKTQIVVITGSLVTFDGGGFYSFGETGPTGIFFDQLDPETIAGMSKLLQDVRCYNANVSNTTSLADETVKWAIATKMQNVNRAAGFKAKAGSLFTVTWADEGTTTYIVTGAIGDTALNPVPSSEKQGDGAIKPGPVCSAG